ncbi:transcription termination factor Rho [Georgenia sp. Z1491]|uniref:transcription termination factor Rho n=1 Tax=Georgenia sp. Z1491 TaxID=3416707 RepID=UPI003CEF5DE5
MTDTIDAARQGALTTLKLTELQAIASQMGLKGTARMRKSDLVEAIRAGRSAASGSAPAGEAPAAATTAAGEAPAAATTAGSASGDEPSTDRSSSRGARAQDRQDQGSQDEGSQDQGSQGAGAEQGGTSPEPRQRRSRRAVSAPTGSGAGADALPDLGIELPDRPAAGEGTGQGGPVLQAPGDSADSRGRRGDDARSGGGRQGARDQGRAQQDGSDPRRDQQGGSDQNGSQQGGSRQAGSRQNGSQQNGSDQGRSQQGDRGQQRRGNDSGGPDFTLDDLGEAASRRREGSGQNNQRGNDWDDDGGPGGRRRRNRDRNRDRRRRGRGNQDQDIVVEETEVSADDVLLPVAGIVDILDQYAFVRTSGYLPGSSDVYVTLNQVRKFGLRRGDAVTGAVRQTGDDNGGQGSGGHGGGGRGGRNQKQKFNPLVRLDTVNGMTVERARQRPEFGKLTPLYPQDQLRLETTPKAITPRVIDLVSPIGKGQRGLIVSPPKAGKTIIMQQIANAIAVNNPDVHLMVVLVDERPEEVTDMQRLVKGEVIASTFDRPASDHTVVAELAIERAKRLVELGQDVVVLLDSLTRLSRAYNLAAPASGRILSGGVDAAALYPPKKFFGAARNIEHGGSLTILASALVETGSKMDEVIFEEFKGTGNMELRLSRQLADKRIFPAVDVNASGTRREELLMAPEELKIMWKLRRVMGALDLQQSSDLLLGKLRETTSNAEFLMTVQKNTPTTPSNSDPDYAIQ